MAVEYKGRYHVIEFQVVDADLIPVLGLQTFIDLQLIQRLYTVTSSNTQETKPEILSTYADQFRGIGALPGEYEIKIDESATPVVHPPRRTPYILKDKVRAELCQMEEMGIITKVEQPTKWVNPIVVIRKHTGDHDHTLKQVLERAAKNDLRFMSKGASFKCRKLNMWDMFLGLMA